MIIQHGDVDDLSYPYFGQTVPLILLEEAIEVIHPLEWVAYYDENVGTLAFAQVGYPILPDGYVSFDEDFINLEYNIYLKEDDKDGKVVSIWRLFKFMPDRESYEIDERSRTMRKLSSSSEAMLEKLPDDLREIAKNRLKFNWLSSIMSKIVQRMLSDPDLKICADSGQRGRNRPARKFIQTKPDVATGLIWIKQAEVEFDVLEIIEEQAKENNKGFGLVCFLSHQVSEKALKGAVCALRGEDGRKIFEHRLNKLLKMVGIDLSLNVSSLQQYYLNTRYPNTKKNKSCKDIPDEHYKEEDARKAKDTARNVLEEMKERIEQNSSHI